MSPNSCASVGDMNRSRSIDRSLQLHVTLHATELVDELMMSLPLVFPVFVLTNGFVFLPSVDNINLIEAAPQLQNFFGLDCNVAGLALMGEGEDDEGLTKEVRVRRVE